MLGLYWVSSFLLALRNAVEGRLAELPNKKGLHRDAARFKIQYPMKNQDKNGQKFTLLQEGNYVNIGFIKSPCKNRGYTK